MMIDTHLAKLVNDDGNTAAVVRGQQPVEKGRLTRAQKSGDNNHGCFFAGAWSMA